MFLRSTSAPGSLDQICSFTVMLMERERTEDASAQEVSVCGVRGAASSFSPLVCARPGRASTLAAASPASLRSAAGDCYIGAC